jgi:hypothetical protein
MMESKEKEKAAERRRRVSEFRQGKCKIHDLKSDEGLPILGIILLGIGFFDG